jgi:hypothetical protein
MPPPGWADDAFQHHTHSLTHSLTHSQLHSPAVRPSPKVRPRRLALALPPNHRLNGSAKVSLRTPAPRHGQSPCLVDCAAQVCVTTRHGIVYRRLLEAHPSAHVYKWNVDETARCWCLYVKPAFGHPVPVLPGSYSNRNSSRFCVQTEMNSRTQQR